MICLNFYGAYVALSIKKTRFTNLFIGIGALISLGILFTLYFSPDWYGFLKMDAWFLIPFFLIFNGTYHYTKSFCFLYLHTKGKELYKKLFFYTERVQWILYTLYILIITSIFQRLYVAKGIQPQPYIEDPLSYLSYIFLAVWGFSWMAFFIINSNEKDQLLSRKVHGGLGIKSMQTVVAHHNGKFTTNWNDNEFTAYAYFYLPHSF